MCADADGAPMPPENGDFAWKKVGVKLYELRGLWSCFWSLKTEKTCMDDSQRFWSMFITLNWVTLFLSNRSTTFGTQPSCRLWFAFASTFGNGSTLKESVFVAKFQGFLLQNGVGNFWNETGRIRSFVFFPPSFWQAHTHMQDQDMCKLWNWVIIWSSYVNQTIRQSWLGSSDAKLEGFFEKS